MFLPVENGAIDITPIANLMRKELVSKKPKNIDMGLHDAVNSDLQKIRKERQTDDVLAPIMKPYEEKSFVGSIIEKLKGG